MAIQPKTACSASLVVRSDAMSWIGQCNVRRAGRGMSDDCVDEGNPLGVAENNPEGAWLSCTWSHPISPGLLTLTIPQERNKLILLQVTVIWVFCQSVSQLLLTLIHLRTIPTLLFSIPTRSSISQNFSIYTYIFVCL